MLTEFARMPGARRAGRASPRNLRCFQKPLRLLAIVLFVSIGAELIPLRQNVARADASNPIVVENQQAGTTGWQFDDYNKASHHEIEGYASLTSVSQGAQVSLMVSLSAIAQYTMDFYRMGYYPHGANPDGSPCSPCGGRLMLHVGPLTGSPQPACPTTTSGPDFGMVECRWSPSYTLTIPSSWTTGNYIVKLTRLDNHLENYMTFVVKDGSSTADIVYSMDVTTWQAYNYWGGGGNKNIGYNLYGKFNDVTQDFISDTSAYTVSFDRPYLVQGSLDGAGNLMVWDYPMIRWMEAQGYDITYVTDIDLEANPALFNGHKVFVNTGHDEYYSDNMRANIQTFIANGGSAAFFSADDISRRMTWADSVSGQPNRREHCDKGALPDSTTGSWRDLSPPQPENEITGALSNGAASARPFLVYDPTSWVFAGTGLAKYNGTVITNGTGQNAIAGLIGYEFSTRAVNDPTLSTYISYEPPGLQQVGHSFVPASDNGVNSWADTTVYTTPAGGTVFSAGTIQWSWGVDNGFNNGFCDCNLGFANAKSQIITANVLNRMVAGSGINPAPAVSITPTSVSFGNQAIGQASAGKAVTLTNTGSAALTINSIGLNGANPADFALATTCPVSPNTLAAGASCTLTVIFTPSVAGTRTASISVSDNAPGSPHTVPLDGTGVVPAPGVTLSPTSVSFGNQNLNATSSARTITLTSSGTAPLAISSIALGGTNAGDFAQTNTCPISPDTLAVGASCTVSVTFTPTATGARSASLNIADDASGSPHSVSLSGSGVIAAPVVSLNPTSLSFGSQIVGTTSSAQTVTLANNGTAPLTMTSISLIGTNAADFALTTTCPIGPSTLPAGATCLLVITFTPAGEGNRLASVSISDNASGSPHTISLSGSGVVSVSGVTLVGSASADGDFGGGVRITIPAVQAGDLLIAVAGTNGFPSNWTTPTGWTAGANGGYPDGQGLNWWWKIAGSADSGTAITLKASSYADGGAIILAYRGASSHPIQAMSALATNDNGGNGYVTMPQFNAVSWTGAANVVSLLLMSWQPDNTTIAWPTGYTTQATATDQYSYVAAGANLTAQSASSLSAQTCVLANPQALVPTLHIAILVG